MQVRLNVAAYLTADDYFLRTVASLTKISITRLSVLVVIMYILLLYIGEGWQL